jgi:DNA-directed RNA polymerase beta' subunit
MKTRLFDDFAAARQNTYRGAEEGQQAKRLSNQELGALVGHGAMAYLQEIATIKGTRNDEWAARYQAGQDLPTVRVPFVYDKFLNYLRGLGVDPVRSGSVTRLQLMADRDIDRLAGNREVRVAETVLLHRDMKPLAGGLFDPAIFGDDGKQFAKYKLSEPIPNPLLEKPLRSLMGVTEKQYRDILSGQEPYGQFGKGPQAIAGWLKQLDPDRQQAQLRARIPGAAITTRDRMIKQLRYLSAIQKHNLKPEDLMLSRVPIIPPIYRPISKLAGKDSSLIDGMNHLYQQMIIADQNLKELSGMSDEVQQERLSVYDSVRSAFGLTDPADPELRRKHVSGLMKRITGPRGPKSSMVQSKLLSTTIDHVGRGVILPNANLDLDQIGVPEEQAWEMFRLPVMRRLTRRGMPVHIAKQIIDDRKPIARDALDAEMSERPVTSSRAPVLHKFGLMGFMPKIVQGHSLQLNPLVYGGFSADNDGNCVDYHQKLVLDLSGAASKPSLNASSWLENLRQNTGIRYDIDCSRIVVKIGQLPRIGKVKKAKSGRQLVYNVPDGVRVLSYNPQLGQPCWSPISNFTVDLEHEVVEVTTARKRKVIVSRNESLAVFDTETNSLVRCRPEDALGKFSPTLREVSIPEPDDPASWQDGWMLAAYVANGWRTDRMAGYAHNDKVLRSAFVAYWKQRVSDLICREYLDDGKGSSKFSNSAKVHLRGRQIASLMPDAVHPHIKHYGTNRTWVEPRSGKSPWANRARPALFKRIPGEAFALFGRQAWIGFLCGYLENDGTLLRLSRSDNPEKFQDHVILNTSSPYLVEDLRIVLRSLGLRYSLGVKQATASSHKGFSLVISTTDLQRISGELHFLSEPANGWLKGFVSKSEVTKDDIDVVPISSKFARASREKLGSKNKQVYGFLSKAMLTSRVSRLAAKKIIGCLEGVLEIPESWRRIVEADSVCWDEIRSVEPLDSREVYDIGVPDTKVFALNNDLVIWDTMNFHAVITDEAAQEVKDRMLPSSNLRFVADFSSPMFSPRQDHLLGLHLASTRRSDQRPVQFATLRDAAKAHARGEIGFDTPVRIRDWKR